MGLLKTLNFLCSSYQKKDPLSKVLIPISWCKYIPVWKNEKFKYLCLRREKASKVNYTPIHVPFKNKKWAQIHYDKWNKTFK